MATINMFRGFLVAGAVFAVIVAAVYGQWAAVAILSLAIAFHAALWVRLHRERAAAASKPAADAQPPGVSAP